MLASFLFQLLQLYHLAVFLTGGTQLLMGTEGCHRTVIDEEHLVHLLDGGDAVGNQNRGLALAGSTEIAQNRTLRFGVNCRHGVIQNENGRVF